MKVLSFNINGLKANFKGLNELLTELISRNECPDVICLQESKIRTDKARELLFQNCSVLRSCKWQLVNNAFNPSGFHGVLCLINDTYDVLSTDTDTFLNLLKEYPARSDIKEGTFSTGRIIYLKLQNKLTSEICHLMNIYAPNAGVGSPPLKWLDYRINTWDKFLYQRLNELSQVITEPLIITGDLNVARTTFDVNDNKRRAGFTVEERNDFEEFLKAGNVIDIWRDLYPDLPGYTYDGSWLKMRLDYFLLNKNAYDTLKSSLNIELLHRPCSDHIPMLISY